MCLHIIHFEIFIHTSVQVFFKENVRYPVWICRDPISLILQNRFSLILATRFEILGTRIGSLKHLKKTCISEYYFQNHYMLIGK